MFRLEMPKSKTETAKQKALEIKRLLKIAEDEEVCGMGNKVVETLKEEQYKLSREM